MRNIIINIVIFLTCIIDCSLMNNLDSDARIISPREDGGFVQPPSPDDDQDEYEPDLEYNPWEEILV